MSISKSQQFFENLWYRDTPWWLWIFLPFHLLLSLLVWLRRRFYKWGIFNSYKADVPVIVIGNVSIGGTGKTPFAIYLLNQLKLQGYNPGLVTRGYGGDSSKHPLVVNKDSPTELVGDEPKLIFNNTQVPIVVDYRRARGARRLVSEFNCDLIICDDGLQHYALQRDLEVLIIDGTRGFGNGFLMPFGPLRETIGRSKKCDISIINGQQMQLQAQAIRKLVTHEAVETVNLPLTAIAAIGNPQRFYNTLKELELEFETQNFPDHHKFTQADFASIDGNIIMTEKDAVKCSFLKDERFYYLPVSAQIDDNIEQQLLHLIAQKIEAKAHES
ncbi:MAG: tetraacyldisaccharide 4'-kinase [Gammaproteobacteria bacterium]|nr:tetraacyldisaccharide 4'-kinase [Gammaproteobacteria bacterium]